MSEENKNHETQHIADYSELESPQINSMIEEAQRSEGGGPPKKVNFKSMPKPIRIFGYFFIVVMILMVVFAILSNYF
ncbi:hypothetical protein [Paenibacillus sp. KN14-4R]|uniref:hypothetical protein n=1 Tax=Paenibacillus sp. KN14-4R TaxID=3445773 RepID=UPI003FA0293B